MKKLLVLTLTAALLLTFVAGCGGTTDSDSGEIVIGVAIRKFDDTFLTDERTAIQGAADAAGVTVDIVDSQASQVTQNEKIDQFITKDYSVLAVNMQDRDTADVIIQKAMDADVPVVFFNTEPLEGQMDVYPGKAFYVGAKAEESGLIQGQILADYFAANPEIDVNGDGVLQIAILKGENGHQDAELRTEYCQVGLTNAGVAFEVVAEDNADWDRVLGQDKMQAFLTAHPEIEAVFANNDDMALGAIEALKAAGYFGEGEDALYMPVIGVDATTPGKVAIREGTMLGTALNDAQNQGVATFNLAYVLAKGEEVTSESVGYEITDGMYIWIPYVAVTLDNVDEFGD